MNTYAVNTLEKGEKGVGDKNRLTRLEICPVRNVLMLLRKLRHVRSLTGHRQ